MVWSLAFSPDGRRLAIGQQSLDDRLSAWRLWDLEKHADVTWILHPSAFRSVAFSPDGRLLATGSFDGTAAVYRVEDGTARPLRSQDAPGAPINSVVFLPDGKTFATADWSGTIILRDVASGRASKSFNFPARIFSIAVSPDGSTVAAAGQARNVLVYDLKSGGTRQLIGHREFVESVAFSPDGKTLASASWDGTVRLWDVASWKTAPQDGPWGLLTTLSGHNRKVLCVRFSPDGKLLATSEGEPDVPHNQELQSEIRLWDVASRREIASLLGHSHSVFALAFSPDGKTLASGSMDQTVKLWEVPSGKLKENLVPGKSGTSAGIETDPNVGMRETRPQKEAATAATFGTVPSTGMLPRPKYILPHGNKFEIRAVAYSPDGKILITGGSSGVLARWEVKKLPSGMVQLGDQISNVNKVAFSHDGRVFATANNDDTIGLWGSDGNQLALLKGHTAAVRSVAFSPDGRLLASGSWDKRVKIWDVVTRREICTIAARQPVNAVTFSPDGKLLATGTGAEDERNGTPPPEVNLWDPVTGKFIENAWPVRNAVVALDYSSDGGLVMALAACPIHGDDGGVRHTTKGVPAEVCRAGATAIASSPNGDLIAAGEENGTLWIWKSEDCTQITRVKAHDGTLLDLSFSPGGHEIATAGRDGAVKVWSVDELFQHGDRTFPLGVQ
jgi:WD40 repeat protein